MSRFLDLFPDNSRPPDPCSDSIPHRFITFAALINSTENDERTYFQPTLARIKKVRTDLESVVREGSQEILILSPNKVFSDYISQVLDDVLNHDRRLRISEQQKKEFLKAIRSMKMYAQARCVLLRRFYLVD